MRARPLLRERITDGEKNLREMVIWQVPRNLRHPEGVRYRLAFLPHGQRKPAVLYDNHHPKGHHRHIEDKEESYRFAGLDKLRADFERDIADWL